MVFTFQVEENDGLPQRLCEECFAVLNSASLFRRQCIKMDAELKLQLESLLKQTGKKDHEQDIQDETANSEDDFANNPMKQLESIIKREPTDSDDDYYYVLVIDDPKDKDKQNNVSEIIDIKEELAQQEVIEKEPIRDHNDDSQTMNPFRNSYGSFMISNNKVPVNVPATILENEEESPENEDSHFDNVMDIEESQDSTSQDQHLPHIEDSEDACLEVQEITDIVNTLPEKNSIIKILTTGADGTIFLKGDDGIQYLTTDTQLITNDDDGDPMGQEEVIFCEGDDTSQFQILKCDGSELVIEYADSDQIATVLKQEDGSFLCDCGEQFQDLSEYEKHQFKHNPAGEHLCNLCGKGFESAEILTGHMLLHNVAGLLVTCPFCHQVIRRNALTQHIKYGHNNIKPKCDLCSKTFANPNNLKRHMMIHSGIREFECDICLKRFHQKITMQTHRLTHMNPFACNQCDMTFENKTAMQSHKESDECSMSKVKKVKEELMKTVKQEIKTNFGKLLGYACSLCKKMFSLETALEQHVESTHMIDPNELLCSECGEVLPSKKEMQSHMMTHKNYRQRNAKRFECSVCRKSCSSQAMLIMHERVHTNERPYPCALCSLRFKTKTHLRTHQLTHTREKKFGCSVCMKFFALKGNLVVHLRTHTGERPYACTLCGEAFIDSKYLKKHKLKKHAIDNVPWNQY